MNTEEYYKIPKDLARANGYFSLETGAAIKLTPAAKLVFSYMLARNDFFTNKLSGSHFETQTTIAEACGIEYKACGKILRGFIDNGVLSGEKLRPNGEGQWRWFYSNVCTDMKLWTGNINSPEPVPETRQNAEVKANHPSKIKQDKVSYNTNSYNPLDDIELPF